MRHFIIMSLLSLMAGFAHGQEAPIVTMQTNVGNIVLELDPTNAPETVKNFLAYVEDGTYVNTIFHRVIKGFMIQGGGYGKDYKEKPTQKPIQNESDNGLKNKRGTVSMARTNDPHSATSQFFINVADNTFLDHRKPANWGYAVFGKVIEGMEIVDKIQNTATGRGGPFAQDVPQEPIVIEKVTVTHHKAKATPDAAESETPHTSPDEADAKKKVTAKQAPPASPPDLPTEPDLPAPSPY
jgi:cyclophilin family peptidyl-prolyl cis-trans isomerase